MDLFGEELLAGKSTHIEWLKPVYADDVLTGKAEVTALKKEQTELLKKTSTLLKKTNTAMKQLEKLVGQVNTYPEGEKRARFCRQKLVPAMEALRSPVDQLEMLVDKSMWPMPSYGDLIFEV